MKVEKDRLLREGVCLLIFLSCVKKQDNNLAHHLSSLTPEYIEKIKNQMGPI